VPPPWLLTILAWLSIAAGLLSAATILYGIYTGAPARSKSGALALVSRAGALSGDTRVGPGPCRPGVGRAGMRRAAVSATEGWVTLLDTGFMPAFQAPRSRSTAGDGGTLAPANHRLIGARYREVMHAACERGRWPHTYWRGS
jgi:hypothetical protein